MDKVDFDLYYEYKIEQRSESWFHIRKGLEFRNPGRISGSTVGACLGFSKFDTVDEIASYLKGATCKTFTPEQMDNMNYGTHYEPLARDWYSNTTSSKVIEIGYCISKAQPRYGFSPDGVVLDSKGARIGLIEIKCVKRMYRKLKEHLELVKLRNSILDSMKTMIRDSIEYNKILGSLPKIEGNAHIYPTHLAQMQYGCEIMNLPWCDYIVYCPNESSVFCQRVYRQQEVWGEYLFPQLEKFIKEKLETV